MRTWVCYHVIGDQLRGAHGISHAVLGALRRRARRGADGARAGRASRRRAAQPATFAWAVAATLAAVTVVGLDGVLDGRGAARPPSPRRARRRRCARRRCRPPADVPADYLLAHQEYSPATAIQGGGSYLRAVATHRRTSPGPDRSTNDPMMRRVVGSAMRHPAHGCWRVCSWRLLLAAPLAQRAGCRAVADARRRRPRARSTTPAPSCTSGVARRDVPPRAPERGRPGVRKAAEPRRSGARDRAHRPARCASTSPTPRSCASSRARSATCFRRCRPSRSATSRSTTTSSSSPASASPDTRPRSSCSSRRTACATATRFWSDATTGPAAQGAPRQRQGRGRRAVRVHRRHRQREDRQGHGEAVLDVRARRLAGEAGRTAARS